MSNIFNKIIKLNFNVLIKDGKIYFNDYLKINKLFNRDSMPIETDEKLHDFLSKIFSDISNNTAISFFSFL